MSGANVAGVGDGRLRRAASAAAAGLLAKALQLITLVATVPILYATLGAERYGLWATLTAINAFLIFADLGIGNGLTTVLGRAHGAGDVRGAQRAVSAAYVSLGGVAALLALLGAVLLPLMPWARVLGVDGSSAAAEAGAAAAVVMVCLTAAVPLGLAARIRLGRQEAHVAGLWDAAGQGLALILVVAGGYTGWGVPALLAAALAPPLVAQALHTAQLLWSHPFLRPSWRLADRAAVETMLHTGSLFLVIQVCTAVAYSFDPLFCAHVFGPAAAADLAVAQRLFVIPIVLVGLALTPLWPAYGEALARGDQAWARRTWYRSLAGTAALVLIGMPVAVWLAPEVLRQWVGNGYTPSTWLVVACAAAAAVQMFTHAVTMLANGAGRLHGMAVGAALLALLSLFGKPLAGWWLGPSGIIAVTAVGTLLVYTLPSYIIGRAIVARPPNRTT